MKKLDHILKQLISRLSAQDQQTLCKSLSGLQSIYPFNKHEYVLAYIMGQKKMTLNEYLSIRSEYLKSCQALGRKKGAVALRGPMRKGTIKRC